MRGAAIALLLVACSKGTGASSYEPGPEVTDAVKARFETYAAPCKAGIGNGPGDMFNDFTCSDVGKNSVRYTIEVKTRRLRSLELVFIGASADGDKAMMALVDGLLDPKIADATRASLGGSYTLGATEPEKTVGTTKIWAGSAATNVQVARIEWPREPVAED